MSDLVLKLLAIHGSDIDAIYRAYEVEYRNRKALDSTCGLFQTSRELIRKFVVGDAKHQAAAELDVLDPAGKVRMNALKQPVVRVPDGVFESSQAAPVSYDPIFVEPASATSSSVNPYLTRAKALLSDPQAVARFMADEKARTGRNPPTCPICKLPVRADTHPMRQAQGVQSKSSSCGIRYCPIQHPDLEAFDRDILPKKLAERADKLEKCGLCGKSFDDVEALHRLHPDAQGRRKNLFRHCPTRDPPFEDWCKDEALLSKLKESERARMRNSARKSVASSKQASG